MKTYIVKLTERRRVTIQAESFELGVGGEVVFFIGDHMAASFAAAHLLHFYRENPVVKPA